MMSRSETGVMNSAGLPATNSSQPVIQAMHLGYVPDPSSIFKPAGPDPYQGRPSGNGDGMSINIGMTAGGGGSGSDGILKKKRGRPRKYGPDGSMAIPLSVAPPHSVSVSQPAPGFTITQAAPPLQQRQTPPSLQQQSPPPHPPLQQRQAPSLPQQQTPPPLQQQHQQLHSAHQVNVTPVPAPGPAPGSPQAQASKKARGRPPGASNKKHQSETLGSPGIGFTPHVIIVKAGEDVASKIMSFSQNGPRAICILSANGALSNVTLRQAATSGGSVTYEGRFEILSLSGSFMLSDNEGHRSRTGGLSISLAGPDGRVVGGGVAGLLIAASPVQVVVASFMTDDRREVKTENQMEAMSGVPKLEAGMGPTGTGTGASSPTSRGTVSESSGGGGSPINHGGGGTVNSTPNMHGLPWM